MKQLRLQHIKAAAHPEGNRVDLEWLNPEPHLFPGVRVMRREGTYPTSPTINEERVADVESTPLFLINLSFESDLDNKILSTELSGEFVVQQIVLSPQALVSVLEAGNRWLITDRERMHLIVKSSAALDVYLLDTCFLTDEGLRAEVVYYYAFFPYKKETTAPTGRVYIYDRKNRVSAMATGPYDFAGQMHRILPTIYHRYDTVLPPKKYIDAMSDRDKQRGQLRRFLDLSGTQLDQLYSFATAVLNFHDIHRVDGELLSLLAQWIGWDSDYNLEFAAQRNELRNAPAMYQTIGIIPNIEAAVVKCTSSWIARTREFMHNIFLSNRPEQLNLWLCQRNSQSQQWEEPRDVFSLDFAYEGRPAAAKDAAGTLWLFYHTPRDNKWEIWCKTRSREQPGEQPEKKTEEEKWTPSVPVTDTGPGSIDQHPTAAVRGGKLWLAWDSFNREKQAREIKYRGWSNGQWTDISIFDDELAGTRTQRKSPQLVVDSSDRLWWFWLEKAESNGRRWQMKYNREHGENLEFHPSRLFPADSVTGEKPRVEKDLFVLCQKGGEPSRDNIWVFWTRKQADGNGSRKYWQIAYRKLSNLDSAEEGDWGPIHVLPKDPPRASYDDCEPAVVVYQKDGNEVFELYWSSNRSGSWSLWHVTFTGIDPVDLSTAEMLFNSPYSQRTPLPLSIDDGISLLYRSNASISYRSSVYGATVTTDLRYSGSTTVDIRNRAKIGLLGTYEDFQTYTYDTGKNGQPTNDDWYARDTIGLYLTPDTDDQQLIMKNRELIKGVLKRFLPIQTRPTFIISPPLYKELIYTYDFLQEDNENPRHIKEMFFDGNITEVYPGVSDKYEDRAPGWTWLCSWSEQSPDHYSVDFSKTPVTTKFRTWHRGIKK